MTREQILELTGYFTWLWDDRFFIETPRGNFIWSDPGYNGSNEIRKIEQTYDAFLAEHDLPFGRCKGTHMIKDYCGSEVQVIE